MLFLQAGTQTPVVSLSTILWKAPLDRASGEPGARRAGSGLPGSGTLCEQATDGMSRMVSRFLVCSVEDVVPPQREKARESLVLRGRS